MVKKDMVYLDKVIASVTNLIKHKNNKKAMLQALKAKKV